jgi:hypothetical protein
MNKDKVVIVMTINHNNNHILEDHMIHKLKKIKEI